MSNEGRKDPTEVDVLMNKIKIQLVGKVDKAGNDYYFTTTDVPCTIDLNNAVIHVFPFQDDDDEKKFGAELVVRRYAPNEQEKSTRRRPSRSRGGDPK